MYLSALQIFITTGPIMSLSWSCQDKCRYFAGRCKLNRALFHVIAIRANPTQCRGEDRTGNRRGFTRFSFGKRKKNETCGRRSESRDAFEAQEIKAEIVKLSKIPVKKIHTYVRLNYSKDIRLINYKKIF